MSTQTTTRTITWTIDEDGKTTGDFVTLRKYVVGACTIRGHTQPNATAGLDGAMLNPGGSEDQGYDSRAANYDSGLNAALLYGTTGVAMVPGDCLVCAISFSEQVPGYFNPTSGGTEFDQSTVSGGSPTVITRTGGWGSAAPGDLVVWGGRWGGHGEIRTVASVAGNNLTVNGEDLTPDTGLITYVGGNLRPYVKVLECIHCVASAPAATAFAPSPAGRGEALRDSASIDWNQLLTLAAPAAAPDLSLASMEEIMLRPWIDQSVNYGFMEGTSGHDNMAGSGLLIFERWYGEYRCTDLGEMMLYLHTDAQTLANKKPLAREIIQYGIDLLGFVDAGANFPAGGAQGPGRLSPIFFAGKLLNDADLLAVRSDYPSTNFGEIDQSFQIDATDVATTHAPQRTGYAPDASADYAAGDIGVYEWGNLHNTDRTKDDKSLLATYRQQNGQCQNGHVLAMAIMGCRNLIGHEPWFRYFQRYMAEGSVAKGTDFTEAMWTMYAASYMTPESRLVFQGGKLRVVTIV